MPLKPNDEIRKKLEQAALKAYRVYLAEYIGRIKEADTIPLPELLLEALRKLSVNKRIKYDKSRLLISAVSWLLEEVPDTDNKKTEIISLYLQARSRLVLAQHPKKP